MASGPRTSEFGEPQTRVRQGSLRVRLSSYEFKWVHLGSKFGTRGSFGVRLRFGDLCEFVWVHLGSTNPNEPRWTSIGTQTNLNEPISSSTGFDLAFELPGSNFRTLNKNLEFAANSEEFIWVQNEFTWNSANFAELRRTRFKWVQMGSWTPTNPTNPKEPSWRTQTNPNEPKRTPWPTHEQPFQISPRVRRTLFPLRRTPLNSEMNPYRTLSNPIEL